MAKSRHETKDSEKSSNEEQLQLPESSDSSLEVESSSEDDIQGFSSDEGSDEEAKSTTKDNQKDKDTKAYSKYTSGHAVNKTIKSQGQQNSDKKQKRAIVYIGRIPHGFYENEIRKYFDQFGDVINLKVSRNKKSGKSKHYGFVEFADYEVAKIASETMDNYLLFGHLLRCRLLDSSPAYDKLFTQSSKFKVIPWKKISKYHHDKPKSSQKLEELAKSHKQRKVTKSKELKKKGIDFDLANI